MIKRIINTLIIIIKIYLTNKKIYLGPFHGEFGFEIMYHQALFNSLKEKWGDRIYVVSKKSSRGIYREIKFNNFIENEYDIKNVGYAFGNESEANKIKEKFLEKNKNQEKEIYLDLATQYIPIIRIILGFKYKPFVKRSEIKNKIVFHFRNIEKIGDDKRKNFSKEAAYTLVEIFNNEKYLTSCIGDPSYSYAPINVKEDNRSENIIDTINELAKAKICIGQLSGPIHLANLCKIDVITWAEGEWRFKIFPEWNPFKAKINIVSKYTFEPEINEIYMTFKTYCD